MLFFLLDINFSYAGSKYVEGELLVKFKKGTWGITKSSTHLLYKANLKNRFEKLNIDHVELKDGITVEKALRLYKSDPDVEYAEPNYYVKKAVIPNDTYYTQQWHHEKISSEKAWEISTGTNPVLVAVVDTGIDYKHHDLTDNIWNQIGKNIINNSNDPMDDDIDGEGSHGTHIAGIIGAIGNNNLGVAGINWKVQLMAVKVFPSNGDANISHVVSGIEYAINNNAKIINLSMEIDETSRFLFDAVEMAQDNKILIVAAAGNLSKNVDYSDVYPASINLDNVIAVAATNEKDEIDYYSNYGKNTIHIAAPGTNIYSTRSIQGTRIFSNYSSKAAYFFESGTSMAAPMVTGAAALLWSKYSNYNYRQIRELLLATVDKKNYQNIITKGRLNVFRALSSTIDNIPPAPPSRLSIENFIIDKNPTLKWEDNSEVETKYTVERRLNSGNTEQISSLPSNTTTFTDFEYTVSSSDDVTYIICAENSYGSNCNEITRSSTLSVPQNLTVTQENNKVRLTWEYSDNSIDGFIIKRSDNFGSFQEIASVGVNTTTYLDETVGTGTYRYRVLAYKGSRYSSESDVVTITVKSSTSKQCFIATAIFGIDHPHTNALRLFRDKYLMTNNVGRTFVKLYYASSPHLVNYVEQRPVLRTVIKLFLLTFVFVINNFFIVFSISLVLVALYLRKKRFFIKHFGV